ncbi:MAG: hypothetical protein OWS74_06270 [Firmicutes bacterium]|nr:hypothetical protein [Bacillota bacterium]
MEICDILITYCDVLDPNFHIISNQTVVITHGVFQSNGTSQSNDTAQFHGNFTPTP